MTHKSGKNWQRNKPTANRIAAELAAHNFLLNVPAGALTRDVVEKFGVAESTAREAVAIARKTRD